MIAVVGLGNPGKNYDKTVHNMGYMAIDHFAKTVGTEFTKTKYFGRVAETFVGGKKVVLLKPETFMNLSGKSVLDMMQSLKLDISKVLVLVDDIDIDFGSIRIRSKGSAGTHNGLRDIVSKCGSDFPRVRLGVGKPEHGDLMSYVLSKLSDDKLKALDDTFDKVDKAIGLFIKNESVEGIDINRL